MSLLRVVPNRNPAMGLSLVVPSGICLGLRALRWCACMDPVTDASGFPYHSSSDGGLGWCTGAVLFGRRHRPFWVVGRQTRVPCVCACACSLGRVWRAGLLGAFWCASQSPVAVLGALLVCWAPSGLGLPCLWLFLCFLFFVFFALFFVRPLVFCVSCLSALSALGIGVLRPPPSLVFFFSPPLHVLFSCRLFPPLSSLSFFFPVPWCAGCAVRCAGVSWAVERVGVCCCGPCASAGAAVRLRPDVRCSLPVPPSFLCCLLCCTRLVAPCWQRCSSPCCFWWVPCGVAHPLPRVFCAGFFFACRVFSRCASPPLAWLWCPVLYFVVRRVVWCCGLWYVLCCARCCVACLCRVGFLHRVVRRGVVLGPVFVVLCCLTLLHSLLVFFLRCSLPFRGAPGCVRFGALLVRGLCWCACVVAFCAVLSCPCCAGWCFVLLPVVFAFWRLLWLSTVVLVAPGVVFWWCAVLCPPVLCCVVMLRIVPRGVVLLCAVLFRFALFSSFTGGSIGPETSLT